MRVMGMGEERGWREGGREGGRENIMVKQIYPSVHHSGSRNYLPPSIWGINLCTKESAAAFNDTRLESI